MASWAWITEHAYATGDGFRRAEMNSDEYITARDVNDPPPQSESELIEPYTPTEDDINATNWRIV